MPGKRGCERQSLFQGIIFHVAFKALLYHLKVYPLRDGTEILTYSFHVVGGDLFNTVLPVMRISDFGFNRVLPLFRRDLPHDLTFVMPHDGDADLLFDAVFIRPILRGKVAGLADVKRCSVSRPIFPVIVGVKGFVLVEMR